MKAPPLLIPGEYYHIYNRGNNREDIFHAPRNYAYFLTLYAKYTAPVAETYAYCLLKNHFHLLVKIYATATNPSQAFSNFFNAYARSFNRMYGRTGALFQRPFGRRHITRDAYFTQVIQYIHHNPQKHGFVSDFREWPYSSYPVLLTDKPTFVQRASVLTWFGNAQQFAETHTQPDNVAVEFFPEDD